MKRISEIIDNYQEHDDRYDLIHELWEIESKRNFKVYDKTTEKMRKIWTSDDELTNEDEKLIEEIQNQIFDLEDKLEALKRKESLSMKRVNRLIEMIEEENEQYDDGYEDLEDLKEIIKNW